MLLGLVAYIAQNPVAASGTASLTIFVGTVNVRTATNLASHAAATGEQLHQGDDITTGPSTKAAINFPDGSVTRMDSNTEIKITTLNLSGSNQHVGLTQIIGTSWNRVAQLVGGSTYNVTTPNHSTAQVRGTDFEIIIEQVNGQQVVRFDTFNGALDVIAANQTVTVPAGQSTTVASPTTPPSPTVPIPPADQQSSFTVFNTTVNASSGTATSVSPGALSQGQTTPTQPGATVGGTDNVDLDYALGWPGSTFELIVYKPDGTEYQRISSSTPPVHVVVPSAAPGNWSYAVHDVQSNPNEAYWVIVGKQAAQNRGATFTTATPCTHTVTAGQSDQWRVTATGNGVTPVLSASGLPSYATFAPDANGSGVVTFNPPLHADAADVDLLFTATITGQPPVNFGCVEHVVAVPLSSSINGHVSFLSGTPVSVPISLSPGG
ncbi:MAG TPA: FecR domain-containing protein, partial [Candidatus Dormibacteraeota bacterium]